MEKNLYNQEGKLYGKRDYKYDNRGNEMEEDCYEQDGITSRYTYKYDDKGRMIERNMYNSKGRLIFKMGFKYDDNGNKIEQNSYEENGILNSKYSCKYDKYDKSGNWLMKTGFQGFNNIPENIIKRKIEYY